MDCIRRGEDNVFMDVSYTRPPLSEHAQLGMAHGEPGTGGHGGQENLAEALVALRTLEGRHGLPEAGYRSTIVTLVFVGKAEVPIRQRLRTTSPLAVASARARWPCGNGLVIVTHEVERV